MGKSLIVCSRCGKEYEGIESVVFDASSRPVCLYCEGRPLTIERAKVFIDNDEETLKRGDI